MPTKEVSLTISQVDEVFATNWEGRSLLRRDASIVLGKTRVTFNSSEFRVTVSLTVEAPKSVIPDTNRIGDSLGCLTRRALPKYLRGVYHLDVFSDHQFRLASYLPKRKVRLADPVTEYLRSFQCRIPDETFASMLDDYEYYVAARESFKSAVSELREMASELTPAGFQFRQNRIRALLSFVDACLVSADLGHMYSWYHEKQSGVRRYFGELLQRKRTSHPSYKRACEYISRNLFSYSAPDCWRERPPRGPSIA